MAVKVSGSGNGARVDLGGGFAFNVDKGGLVGFLKSLFGGTKVSCAGRGAWVRAWAPDVFPKMPPLLKVASVLMDYVKVCDSCYRAAGLPPPYGGQRGFWDPESLPTAEDLRIMSMNLTLAPNGGGGLPPPPANPGGTFGGGTPTPLPSGPTYSPFAPSSPLPPIPTAPSGGQPCPPGTRCTAGSIETPIGSVCLGSCVPISTTPSTPGTPFNPSPFGPDVPGPSSPVPGTPAGCDMAAYAGMQQRMYVAVPTCAPPPSCGAYHCNKHGFYSKTLGRWIEKGEIWVKNRRMNPLNPRALSRSMRRFKSAKRVEKMLRRVSIGGRGGFGRTRGRASAKAGCKCKG